MNNLAAHLVLKHTEKVVLKISVLCFFQIEFLEYLRVQDDY